MSRAVIVVPCYNEASRLDALRFQEFATTNHAVRFLFVNDGSTDGTLSILERLHAIAPDRFRFVHLSRNSGKAEAVRQGVLTALADRPQYVGYWDADLATPLDEIPRFCRVLDEKPGIQIVIGSRLRLLGHRIERRPLRHWLGRMFANLAGLALGSGIYDTQCGAKLFRADAATAGLFAQRFRVNWIFDVELFARLVAGRGHLGSGYLDQIVYEQPLDRWQDVAGSKVKSRDFVRGLAELGLIYWTYMRRSVAASPAVTARLAQAGHLPPTEQHLPLAPDDSRRRSDPVRQRRAA